jgi:hypothetical protein
MSDKADRHVDDLDDGELLDRELRDRAEYLRLERIEPRSSGTTYRLIRRSRGLLQAWVRWTQSSLAARVRGLHRRG